MNQHDQSVIVALDCNFSSPLLKKKFQNQLDETIPFSLNFQLIRELGEYQVCGGEETQFDCPNNVDISYNHNCILVSDSMNHRVQIFSLQNLKYLTSAIFPKMVENVLVERNGCGRSQDAILVSCDDYCVYKLDLLEILNSRLKLIWISGTANEFGDDDWDHFGCQIGMSLKYGKSRDENVIILCDPSKYRILFVHSINGKPFKEINFGPKTPTFNNGLLIEPWYALMLPNSERMIVNDCRCGRLFLIDDSSCQLLPHPFNQPRNKFRGLEIDESSNQLFVIEHFSCEIFVLSIDQNFTLISNLNAKCTNKTLQYPQGCCLNRKSGELIVCDQVNHQLSFFK